MSASTRTRRTSAGSPRKILSLVRGGLLAIAACIGFGLPTATASDTPATEINGAQASFLQAAPSAGSSSAASASTALSPRMHRALDYVRDRYNVSRDAMRPVFEAVQRFAGEHRMDPLLIVAVIAVESSFNPFATSSMGAMGLMQVIPRYHRDKLPKGRGRKALMDPVTNVGVGTRILNEYIAQRGNLVAGLQYYNGSSDKKKRYAKKVLAEKARLEVALR